MGAAVPWPFARLSPLLFCVCSSGHGVVHLLLLRCCVGLPIVLLLLLLLRLLLLWLGWLV